MIALSVTFGASSPRGGAFGKPVKLILAEQSILYRKMPGLAYGGRHCDTSFIFVVDVMKQKEKPVKNYKMLEPARKLRREMTPQERKLWYAFLKDYPVKIYKQRIIESYIVDFYCAKAGLVIELDGPIHKHEQNIQHDTNRDERLKSYGLEILRIPNTKIDSDFGQVCAYIDTILQCRSERSSSICCPGQQGEESKEPQANTQELPGLPMAPPLGELAQRSCD